MKAKVEGEQSWRRPKLNNFQNFKILKLLDRKRTFRHSAQRRGLLDLNGPSIGRGGEAFFEILSQLIGFGPSRQNVSVTSVVELEEAEFISNFLNNPYSDPESMNLDFFFNRNILIDKPNRQKKMKSSKCIKRNNLQLFENQQTHF